MVEVFIQPRKNDEDEGAIMHCFAKIGEGMCHALPFVAVIGHRHIA